MKYLSDIGRIFYGAGIAGMGANAIYYRDFPYMLVPGDYPHTTAIIALACFCGVWLFVAGLCIALKIKVRQIAQLSGILFLLIVCFYLIPYECSTANYRSFGEWENAEKVLTLSGGAFVIARYFSKKDRNSREIFLSKVTAIGTFLFPFTIICFGIDHFLYTKNVVAYTPSWIPYPWFWAYLAGAGLICSGISILTKIKARLGAFLLGVMIFIWVIILHIPKSIYSSPVDREGEITSAFLALAYCGIAFVISGNPS